MEKKKFRLCWEEKISYIVHVEAENAEEAYEIFLDQSKWEDGHIENLGIEQVECEEVV